MGLGLRLRLGLGLDHWAAVYLPRSLATSKVSCSAVCTSPSSALYSKAARLVRMRVRAGVRGRVGARVGVRGRG